MILGMSTATYTFWHVLISLVGIVSCLIVVYGFLIGKRLDGLTAVFLTTTVLTSLTGFGFPFEHLLPSHKVAIISLVILQLRFRRATFFISLASGARFTWWEPQPHSTSMSSFW